MRSAILTLTLAAALSSVAAAQQPHERSVTMLADGVYMIRHADFSGWVNGNTTVIIGDRDVLVVDSCFTSATAREDIAQIRQWTTKPVRYLVNTHWHQDHTAGNADYLAAFPGVAIVAHPSTLTMLRNTSPTLPSDINRDGIPYKKSIEDRIASGKSSAGQPLTDAERATLARVLSDINAVLDQATTYTQAMPTVTTTKMTVDLGGRIVELSHPGRGNTAGDMVAYLPKEKIAIVGDLLVSPVPFTFDGYPSEWIETLETIRRWPVDAIVPGHGEVMRDHTYLDQVVQLMRTVIDQVEAQLRKNTESTLEDVRKAVDLSGMKKLFAGDDPRRGASFDNAIGVRLVSIVFYELKQR